MEAARFLSKRPNSESVMFIILTFRRTIQHPAVLEQ